MGSVLRPRLGDRLGDSSGAADLLGMNAAVSQPVPLTSVIPPGRHWGSSMIQLLVSLSLGTLLLALLPVLRA